MSFTSNSKPHLNSPITDQDLLFFRQATGITDDDDEQVKKHILSIQEKAYKVYGYTCIRRFAFIAPKIAALPGYKNALELLGGGGDEIFLDVGCCLGTDLRKAVLDGWPVRNVVASDLRRSFWDLGHELFKSTPDSFPVTFVQGDLFDDAFLSPFSSPESASTLSSLNFLIGKVSAIHASSLFHLFPEVQQLHLAQRLSALLKPQPGSIIFGQHRARREKGFCVRDFSQATDESHDINSRYMFCHSPESWRKLWTEDVFVSGSGLPDVKVDAELVQVDRPDLLDYDQDTSFYVMNWSVRFI